MTDPDTQTSVQGDTPSGQEAATDRYPAETGGGASAATGDGSGASAATGDGPGSSAEKDTDAWVTGDEPMTGPQASYLATLAHQAGEPPPADLSKAAASDEIERLQADGSNPAGDPSTQERPTTDWVTGDEPMTGPQASYLATLAQQAGEEAPTGLTKSQASRAIDDLRSKAR